MVYITTYFNHLDVGENPTFASLFSYMYTCFYHQRRRITVCKIVWGCVGIYSYTSNSLVFQANVVLAICGMLYIIFA